MIEYAIQDINGNNFNLFDVPAPAGDSTTYGGNSFSYDTDIIPNSFLAGSVQIGAARLSSRSIDFSLTRLKTDYADYKTEVNELLAALDSAYYLINVTEDKRVKVSTSEINISFDPGSHFQSGQEGFSFIFLNPYWEDNTELTQEESITGNDVNEIAFDNTGYLEMFARFQFVASVSTSYVQVIIENQLLRVQDSLFGTSEALNTMTIDNQKGDVILGNLDRTKQIFESSGFISIPKGESTILASSDQDVELTILYRKRYYV